MAVITPRWLPVDGEEHLGESAPVAFQYGYRDRELAGKNTRMEAIFSLHCHVQRDGAPPLASVVHVLGFRPVVVYQVFAGIFLLVILGCIWFPWAVSR